MYNELPSHQASSPSTSKIIEVLQHVNNDKHNMYTITGSAKDKIPLSFRSNIVYQIPCKGCHDKYIE